MSNDLAQLRELLVDDLRAVSAPTLLQACVIVPESSIRAWLAHELAAEGISLLRIEILLIDELAELQPARPPQLTRHHLTPLLMAFLSCQEDAGSSLPARSRMARKLRLPFAMKAFFATAPAKEAETERLWQQFVAWCPLQIPAYTTLSSPRPSTPLFLFGFSSLSPLLFDQLLSFPTLRRLYLLSPCMLFWEDQASDRELRFFLAEAKRREAARPSVEQLEELLYDRQRLLANSGQIGREFVRRIEDAPVQTRSAYRLPAALHKPPYTDHVLPETVLSETAAPSLLDHVKADLLLLIGKRQALHDLPMDASIAVHAAPTPLREVEALRDRLSQFIELPPASVIVLVTDMPRYTAAIEQVFGAEIPYQIWEQEEQNGVLTAFRMMVRLLMSKGTLTDWLQLLRHPVIQTSLAISSEEAEGMIDWLSRRGIQWGFSRRHKQQYLASRAITPTSETVTFDDEWTALLGSLLAAEADTVPDVALLRPLGNFFHVLQAIEGWWPLPLQELSYAPMDRFAALFTAMVQLLLSSSSGGFEGEALLTALSSFTSIAASAASPQIPTSEALALFNGLIASWLSRRHLDLSAPVIVAPFAAFQPFPAQLVAILGAHEGALPEHSEEQLLSRLDRMMPHIPASSAFLDRYAFVEALLAAQHLFISYQSYAFDTRERVSCSSIVADLLSHLDMNYTVNGGRPSTLILKTHPLARPYQRQRPSPRAAGPMLLTENGSLPSLTLSAVQYAACSPLDRYFREQYAFASSETPSPSMFLKPWEIRKRLERDIVAPTPSASHPTYQKAHAELHAALRKMQVVPTPLTLHLLPTIAAPRRTPTELFAPMIAGTPPVMGAWPSLIAEGIVLMSKNWQQDLFYRWPENALRTYLKKEHEIDLPCQAILVQEQRTIALPPSDALHSWAEFALLTSTAPFPFTFDMVKKLLGHPEADEVYEAIVDVAKKKGGSWQSFANSLTVDSCARHLPQWKRYAALLWADLFTLLETA